MKPLPAFATITCLLAMVGCIAGKHMRSATVIDIKDIRATNIPPTDLAHHKQHDVEVYKTSDKSNAYTVVYYQIEKDSLRSHQCRWGTDADMNKAAYKWIDDTTVSIRLYHPGSRKKIDFEVFGNNGSSGMSFDE